VLIAAKLLANTTPGIVLNRIYHEKDLRRKIYVEIPVHTAHGKTSKQTISIAPDASCEFIVQEKWRDFFHIEVYRYLPVETLWKQKVTGLMTYRQTGQHQALFHTSALSIHEVEDEYPVEKTHPVFYNLAEQWQSFAEYLQDLPPRHFALKLRGQKVKAGKTRHLSSPRVDPQELREVEQEYLQRYFRSKEEIVPVTAETSPAPAPSDETEIPQALSFYQPINRRERLR
jgi:hypothetical protein